MNLSSLAQERSVPQSLTRCSIPRIKQYSAFQWTSLEFPENLWLKNFFPGKQLQNYRTLLINSNCKYKMMPVFLTAYHIYTNLANYLNSVYDFIPTNNFVYLLIAVYMVSVFFLLLHNLTSFLDQMGSESWANNNCQMDRTVNSAVKHCASKHKLPIKIGFQRCCIKVQ